MCWWKTSGSLRTALLRLDGQVGAVVNTEKHVIDPGVVSGELAGQLEGIAQQMGVDTDDVAVERSGKGPGFGPVKPGFTREVGSFRRQVSSHGVRDVGE